MRILPFDHGFDGSEAHRRVGRRDYTPFVSTGKFCLDINRFVVSTREQTSECVTHLRGDCIVLACDPDLMMGQTVHACRSMYAALLVINGLFLRVHKCLSRNGDDFWKCLNLR